MKRHSILTVAAIAAVATLASNPIAGDCAASKSASASTRTGGKDLVAVASGAENFKTDVLAENGVIHAIDSVILPNS